jgi:hypothetical protein
MMSSASRNVQASRESSRDATQKNGEIISARGRDRGAVERLKA